ncbi:hypothetical protein C4D60_Mb10t08760 [Musa balbisiana]|uniref:DUF7722 domain-containing protein n=1 Tax=Musa balbisiana TaxID=52838 RepID=A0A4S8IVM7_MUSBA|nr:hypothetical protein C4D60_Mb10t08760 [Musa balbisiana]
MTSRNKAAAYGKLGYPESVDDEGSSKREGRVAPKCVLVTDGMITRGRSSSMSSVGRGMATMNLMADGEGQQHQQLRDGRGCFQMPVRYPTYTQADYEAMPEWKLNCILREYGLPVTGDIDDKRRYAMGAFLWPAL